MDASEVAAARLDDERDREELRRRYDVLLQEIRVMLPGARGACRPQCRARRMRFDRDGAGRTVSMYIGGGVIVLILIILLILFLVRR